MNLRGCAVSGNFGLIKKFISCIIVSVALIVLSLPVSFAKDSISPVTSSLPEPVPSRVSGADYDTVTLFYVVQWNASSSYASTLGRYCLYEMICRIPHSSTAVFNIKRQQTGLFFSGDRIIPFTRNIYDIVSGTLLESNTNANFSCYGSVNGYSSSYGFTAGYFPENLASSDICAGGFAILPEGISVTGGDSVYNSSPFVTWSVRPPSHNQYHSHLSEPTSDKYNRYFVVDDRLYWISCQLNGFFIRQDIIESTSMIGSFQQMIGDSGSGWTSVNLSGVWYVPVDIRSGDFSDDLPFYLTLVPSQNDIKVVLQPYDFINGTNNGLGQYYLQASFYISEFNLEDGSYVSSVFQDFDQSISVSQYLNFSLPSGSSIHCYGINFYNNQNLPYNLSDVQWEYDLEFVTWRDQMLQQLQEIYALLSSGDSVPETTTYQNFGAEVASGEPSFSDLNAEDVKFQLDQAAGAAADLQPASNTVKGWISDFMPFKLMIPVIFALAFGVVILILGKNKSDS